MDNMNTLFSKDNKSSSRLTSEEFSFAKEIRSSFWDSMVSDKIDMESLRNIKKVLEFVKNDY